MRFIVVLLLALVLVYPVHAVSTSINTLGANNVILLTDASVNGECTALELCAESEYDTQIEVAPYLADNVYSYANDPELILKNDGQGKHMAASWYGVFELGPGTWYVQMMSPANDYDIAIIPYVNESTPSQDVSDWINFTMSQGKQWYNIDVTSAVVESFNAVGYVKFRIIKTSTGGGKQLDEMLLIVPPGAGATGAIKQTYLQLLPQGPTETEIDQVVEHEWNVVSFFVLGNQTLMENPVCKVRDMDGTLMNVTVNTSIDADQDHLKAVWMPNSTLGFEEGRNYELECDLDVLGVTWDELNQYIYVNRDQSFWTYLQDILSNVLSILGIVQDNQVYINQTRDIANQTLATVQALGAVQIQPQSLNVFSGTDITAMAVVTVASVPENGADCTMTVYYPNATKWIDEQNMTAIGDDGIYTTDVSFGEYTGNYQAIAECSGGSLVSAARGTATWIVDDGVRMISIT